MSKAKPALWILLACAMLLAALGLLSLHYGHAAAWRLPADQRLWVERTLDIAAAGTNGTREGWRRATRPRLWSRPDRLCVILRSHRKHPDGSYQVCFDRKTGRSVEERLYGPTFGSSQMADPLWELVW